MDSLKLGPLEIDDDSHKISFMEEFRVLFWRAKVLARNCRAYVRARIGSLLIIGLFTGVCFTNINTDSIGSLDNLNDNLGLYYLMTANMFLLNA